MTPRPRKVLNRIGLCVVGLGLLASGTWLAATDRGVAPRLPSWWPAAGSGSGVLLDRDRLAQLRGEAWWTPTVFAVAAALTLLFVWWALAQLRFGPARAIALPTPGGSVRPQALAEALSTRVASLPGVARCRARVLRRAGGRLEVGLRVWLQPDTPPDAVVAALGAVTAEAEALAAPYTVRSRVRLSAATLRTHRAR
ncbi:hypothetical protein [Streptomyces sp. NPDC088766]|uniref:hypothetical protein n=1 Tax=Streptomyces sp. NPDC088766 TaxID=3365893 RepID=UPI00380EC2D6